MPDSDRADHWDTAAEHYEKTAHPFTARYVEATLEWVPLTPSSHVLDVAAGTGALALAAARTGARVLATDFSPSMVARIEANGLPNVEARVMDGQALDLPDAGFDAVFSMFGVFMFPDWRKGLSEMARMTRPGGHGVVAVWKDRGAGTFLLLGRVVRKMFPDREPAAMPEAVTILSTATSLACEMVAAGYRDPRIEDVTRDFEFDVEALADPDALFGPAPGWAGLNDADKAIVVAEIRRMAGDRAILPVPSTALIAVAAR